MDGFLISPASSAEDSPSFIELILYLCQKFVGCTCVELLLSSLYPSIDLCAYLSTNTTILIIIAVQ